MSGGYRNRVEIPAAEHVASVSEIYARANEIASRQFPNGCSSATILANIVREAISQLRTGASNDQE